MPKTKGPLRLGVRRESAGQPRVRVYYRLEDDGEDWYWLEWLKSILNGQRFIFRCEDG